MIERIISDHPNHLFVIGGDLNCELKGDSPFDEFWNNFRTKKRFEYCSDLLTSPGYTYHHATLDQKKFNDHFLVSEGISKGSICSNHRVLEEGHNPSDHLPILMSMQLEIQSAKNNQKSPMSVPKLRWSKVTQQDILVYHDNLPSLVACQPIFMCNTTHCADSRCKASIQEEYDFIVDSVKQADAVLPRHCAKTFEKSWWTQELSRLKSQSIDIQRLWEAEGRPGQGPTHFERLRVRANYRRALRSAQRKPKQESWNSLHEALETSDTNRFWRSWKTLYNKRNDGFSPVVDGCTSNEAIAESFKKSFQRNSQPNSLSRVAELNASNKV